MRPTTEQIKPPATSWWAGLSREAFSQQARQEQERIHTSKWLPITAPTEGGALELFHRKAQKRREVELRRVRWDGDR